MIRPYEFCKKCQKIRSMSVSVSFIRSENSAEEDQLCLNLHCEHCRSFIGQIPMREDGAFAQSDYIEYQTARPL